MGLAEIVRANVAVAKKAVGNLPVTVRHYAAVSQSADQEWVYAGAVERQAVVDYKQRRVAGPEGQEILSSMSLQFIEPVSISLHDKFTLPDGKTAPVAMVGGVADPATGAPYAPLVYLV
jgi:hypothetical protein